MNFAPEPTGGGDGGADQADFDFMGACYMIEALYGDLLGTEALAHALIDSWGQTELGKTGSIGTGGAGPGDVVDYTMPTMQPYTVHPRIRGATEQGDKGYFTYEGVKAQMTTIFNNGKAGAQGTAEYFKYVMLGVYGSDPSYVAWAADQQLQACTHLHGQLTDDFATVASSTDHPRAGLGPLMDDHFQGSTAEEFRAWYQKVDDVVNQLVDYAGVAQLAAAGTATVMNAAKQAMVQAATSAQQAFQDSVDAWRNDPISFPFPPGTAEKAMKEFSGLISKVEDYASLVPGPIGAAADAAQTTQKVVGAASNLFGVKDLSEQDVKTAARAADLYNRIDTTLLNQYQDVTSALQKLGGKTTPKKNEVLSRSQLVLPVDKPNLHYT